MVLISFFMIFYQSLLTHVILKHFSMTYLLPYEIAAMDVLYNLADDLAEEFYQLFNFCF